jgi:putative transposase
MIERGYIYKSHNILVLLYHFLYPVKYRRVVFSKAVDKTPKGFNLEIKNRYEVHFIEIDANKDHVHFLVQIGAKMSATSLITILKSISATVIFKKHPKVKPNFGEGNSGLMDFL